MTFVDDIKKAESEAKNIISKARSEAEKIRRHADLSTRESLTRFEVKLKERAAQEMTSLEKELEDKSARSEENTKKEIEVMLNNAERKKEAATVFIMKQI